MHSFMHYFCFFTPSTPCPKFALCLVPFVFAITDVNAQNGVDSDTYASINLLEDTDVCEDNTNLSTGFSYAKYTSDCQYNENLTVITDGMAFGFADTSGKVIIAPIFDEANHFDDGLALVKQQGKYGYINPKGDFVIAPTFENAWGFWEGRAKIAKNGKYGFIDKQGNIVINPNFDEMGNWFEYGLVSVKINDKWGFMDKNGQIKIAPIYDHVEDFSEQLALVAKDTGNTDANGNPIIRYGYINPKGKITLPLKYDFATSFINDSAMVINDDNIYFINKKGERVKPIWQD